VTQRTERIDEQLRQEIGAILTREISDPRIGFATITDVETVPDLSHAKVWVSVIGQPDERKATIRALAHALPFIRRQLGTRLHLRRIPELHLELDDTAERGTRLLKLLEDLEAGRTPETAAVPGESLPTPVARLPHETDTVDAGAPLAEMGDAARVHARESQAARARRSQALKRRRR
jgi:ribosome-binding factor A